MDAIHLLLDILNNHDKWSDDELKTKYEEYCKSIPVDIDIFSFKLNEIIDNRFPNKFGKTYVVNTKTTLTQEQIDDYIKKLKNK